MATRGKSINLFLMDGEPSGSIKCTLANWTGVAYKIPRTELEKCKERDDLKQSGVYFLFGVDEETNESVVYVGQAGVRKNGEGILYRLQEHKRKSDKDYWTEAVVFTTSNNSFGPTEISWLENRFCSLAANAKRYSVKNGNDPNLGNVTEEKESELEEFVDYAKIVMGVLGHKIFEPLTETVSNEKQDDSAVDESIYFFKRKDTDAKGKTTSEGFVVLEGSVVRMSIRPSCPDSVKSDREKHKNAIGENGILNASILFKSPSGASSFVNFGSSNGNIDWKTANGKTLKDVENNEAEDVEINE